MDEVLKCKIEQINNKNLDLQHKINKNYSKEFKNNFVTNKMIKY